MWLIAGTIPDDKPGLITDSVWQDFSVDENSLLLPGGQSIPVGRGTSALAATAFRACQSLGFPLPRLLLAGDTGTGEGSARAYEWLSEHLAEVERRQLEGMTFHYFYPDLDGHNRVLMSIQALPARPVLIADAGFMYVAKMSGYGSEYDLFTPDMGELAFLADEQAPHPFYTRGFLLAKDSDAEDLLKRALKGGNCPRNLLVKGACDYIVCEGGLKATICQPSVAAMEAIGGTGDIVTGFATAFAQGGYPICQSALFAARAARRLAKFCNPTPATQAAELIAQIPAMLRQDLGAIMQEPDKAA